MERPCNNRINSRNSSARRAEQEEIVEYPLPKWAKWWLFYRVANNPNFHPFSPTASQFKTFSTTRKHYTGNLKPDEKKFLELAI